MNNLTVLMKNQTVKDLLTNIECSNYYLRLRAYKYIKAIFEKNNQTLSNLIINKVELSKTDPDKLDIYYIYDVSNYDEYISGINAMCEVVDISDLQDFIDNEC